MALPLLPLLLVGGGLAAFAALSSSGSQPAGGARGGPTPGGGAPNKYGDVGMPANLELTVDRELQNENDPAKLRELANAIRDQFPRAAAYLDTKANALSVNAPGSGIGVVPYGPPGPVPSGGGGGGPSAGAGVGIMDGAPPPVVNMPPVTITAAPPPTSPFGGIAGGLQLPQGLPPLPNFPIPIPGVSTSPPAGGGGSTPARWSPPTLPALPPIPAAGRQSTPAHKTAQRQLVRWSAAVDGGAYDASQVDGVIGPITQRTTQRFQAWANQYLSARLTLDGLFGPATYAALTKFEQTATAPSAGGGSAFWAGRPAV
jgi:hypothetical protein